MLTLFGISSPKEPRATSISIWFASISEAVLLLPLGVWSLVDSWSRCNWLAASFLSCDRYAAPALCRESPSRISGSRSLCCLSASAGHWPSAVVLGGAFYRRRTCLGDLWNRRTVCHLWDLATFRQHLEPRTQMAGSFLGSCYGNYDRRLHPSGRRLECSSSLRSWWNMPATCST